MSGYFQRKWRQQEMTQRIIPRVVPKDVECPIVQKVINKLRDRADEGMKTYGTTMERTDIDTVGWIDHTIEELLDAANYLMRLKEDLIK